MKKNFLNYLTGLFLSVFLFTSCGPTIDLTASWSEGTLQNELEEGNNLVLVKLDDNGARYILEGKFKDQLAEKGIRSEAATVKFPSLNPNKKRTEEEVREIAQLLKSENFNIIVLTTLKDVDESVQTETSGGYYVGGTSYPVYYRRFSRYYYRYYDPGVYIPLSSTTSVSRNYHLETVVFDLNGNENEQLLSVSTVEVKDPNNVDKVAAKYAQTVVDRILGNE